MQKRHNMQTETHTRLDEVQKMLNEASRLHEQQNPGAAITTAYNASLFIAAAYLLEIEGQQLPETENTYHQFAKAIEILGRHPQFTDRIRDTVRTVSVLHEAYEPALSAQTAPQDAEQMITHVQALLNVVNDLSCQPSLTNEG
jgi:uncharacterized protein (UPF0332 family)